MVKIVGDYAWEQGQQRFGVSQMLDEFVRTKQTSLFVRILQKIQTRVARSSTRIIVPSEYLKNIVAAWGIPNEKIEVIYNAVILEAPRTVPPTRGHVAPAPGYISRPTGALEAYGRHH